MEVGFSQPSEDLEEKVRKLIRNTTVKICHSIDIKEKPYYKNPFKLESSERSMVNFKTCESQLEKTSPTRSVCLEDNDNPYSPIQVLGVRWVGELTGTVQVFGKDLETGGRLQSQRKW